MNRKGLMRFVALLFVTQVWQGVVMAHDSVEADTAIKQHASAELQPRARHVVADEGHKVWVVGDTYTFKVTGEDTGGRMFVWEASVPPMAGPPPHIHHNQDEAYYLLEGELEVLDGERTFTARAGSFVYIPKGAVHAFRNTTQSPARMVLWLTPAGLENFFLEVGQPARPGETAPLFGPEEMAKTKEAAPKYGLELRVPDTPPAPQRTEP